MWVSWDFLVDLRCVMIFHWALPVVYNSDLKDIIKKFGFCRIEAWIFIIPPVSWLKFLVGNTSWSSFFQATESLRPKLLASKLWGLVGWRQHLLHAMFRFEGDVAAVEIPWQSMVPWLFPPQLWQHQSWTRSCTEESGNTRSRKRSEESDD